MVVVMDLAKVVVMEMLGVGWLGRHGVERWVVILAGHLVAPTEQPMVGMTVDRLEQYLDATLVEEMVVMSERIVGFLKVDQMGCRLAVESVKMTVVLSVDATVALWDCRRDPKKDL